MIQKMHSATPQNDNPQPEFTPPSDFIKDGKPIQVSIYIRRKGQSLNEKIHTSSIGVCPTHADYHNYCAAWLSHIGVCNLFYALNEIERMWCETEIGDVIAEFSR